MSRRNQAFKKRLWDKQMWERKLKMQMAGLALLAGGAWFVAALQLLKT